MTSTRFRPLLAGALAFGAGIAAFAGLDGSEAPTSAAASQPSPGFGTPSRATLTTIRDIQAGLARTPTGAGYAKLAAAYMQQARETVGGPAHVRAQAAIARALELDPRDPSVLTQASAIAANGHEFPRALRLARRARRVAPQLNRPRGIVVDALVELGRRDDAERELQGLLDVQPSSSAYARASYLRELRGDLPGALAAMRLAVSAGGEAPEHAASLQALVGNLELRRGRVDAAEHAYRAALARYPGLPPAAEGLAKVAAARGDRDGAARRFRALADRVPEFDHLVFLAEAELVAGRPGAARAALIRAAIARAKLPNGGAGEEPELSAYEADHGDPELAVRYARIAHRRGHRLESLHALGWALTRAGRPEQGLVWARQAVALRPADALVRFHAGIAARDAGHAAVARRYLRVALRGRAALGPLRAGQAERALADLAAE